MCKLDHKESWVPKNWGFWTVVLEKTPESLLDCKEIKPVNPKGNQPWIFIRRTDAEVEVPILWPSDANSWHWKRPWCWEGLRTKEEGIIRWDGWIASLMQWTWTWETSGDGEGQGGMVYWSPWGCKELDMMGQLNNNDNILLLIVAPWLKLLHAI